MNAPPQDILSAALALPREQRVDLADKLWISLDGYSDHIERAWLEECHRRVAAYERGETESIPAEDVLRSVRESLQLHRAANQQ